MALTLPILLLFLTFPC